jgi:hypothetical protein
MARKVYVNVSAKFNKDGRIIPESFEWEDERIFEIDRITDIRRAASLKVGGAGLRYTCFVCGKQTYLFLEDNRWFIEAK